MGLAATFAHTYIQHVNIKKSYAYYIAIGNKIYLFITHIMARLNCIRFTVTRICAALKQKLCTK